MTTILLIEDNEDIRTNTSEILALANYKVLLAEDGKVGVELASDHRPDLIICDIMMPELDGYGVLSFLKKDEALGSIPFIFMTALEDDKVDGSVGEYIAKPFNAEALLLVIENKLRKEGSV